MTTGQPPPSPHAHSRILVISGDPVLREHLYDVLARAGYSVKTVLSGRLGVETMAREQPALILVSSAANDGPGWGFPDWIRRFNQHVPIIVLGHPNEEPPDPRTANDIQGYFRTDVTDAELLEAVNRWISRTRGSGRIDYIDYPGTILAIDDEPEYLRTLEEFLGPRRCDVATASSGEEGLQHVQTRRPSLVLLDIKMPGMDGLVALKKIKELHPNLPVVMTSAVEDSHLITQAFALGAYEYLVKPYDWNTLKSILFRVKEARAAS